MNRKQYEIDNLPTQIVIGHQTETGVTSIYFDCTSWLASWPDLVLGVWATQPGGTAAYPAATHMEGDVLVWDVTDSDTAVPGVGTVEIVGITTGKKKLSAIAKTQIMRTTTGTTTTPPEGAKAWVDNVMQAASDAETSKTQAATYAEDAEASAKKAEENAKSVTWETLAGKPSAFPPETHGHAMSEVDGLPDALSQLKGDKLDKTATAADSAKLGGKLPAEYASASVAAAHEASIGDAWTSGKTYAVGDYCISDNQLYKCKTAHTAGNVFDPAHWAAVNVASEIASIEDVINARNPVFFGDSGESSLVTKDVGEMENGIYILVNTWYTGGTIWVLRILDRKVSAISLESETYAPSVNGTIVTLPAGSWYSSVYSIKLK